MAGHLEKPSHHRYYCRLDGQDTLVALHVGYVNGVVYNLKGAKLGAVSSAGVVTNAAGKTVGRVVKGTFKGTAFSSKDQTYNHKLVDAAGNQVGLVNADANPNLVAAWAFLMFAKK